MTNDLDTRARAAAGALHESVRALPVESIGRRTRAPQGGRILLAAAAIIAVVAVAVSLVDRGPGEADLSTDASGGAPRLVLDDLPDGMTLNGVFDLPIAGESRTLGTYWVYGDVGADNPFAVSDLAVVQFGADGTWTEPTDGSEQTDVDGHPAWVSPAPDEPGDLGRHTVYVELDGSTLALLSATLDGDALLAAAGQIELDAATLAPPETLGGLRQIGTASGEISPGSTMLPFPTTAGHVVGYVNDDGLESILVASVEGGEGTLSVARWALGATARSVQVQGVNGWSGSPYGAGSTIVIWQDSPSVLVAVVGLGVDEEALLSAAESLRPATEAEWDDLLAKRAERDRASVPDSALAGVSGDGIDGSSYAAWVEEGDTFCFLVNAPGGSSSTCGSPDGPQPLSVLTERTSAGNIVVAGHTTLGTDPGRRITADGALVGSEALYEGGTVFAFVATDASLPAEIVVLSSDGTELGRMSVPPPGPPIEGDSRSFGGQGTPITPPPSG